ncbi:MAG TPA: TonB-dependent receptor plug domain-containing protein, partial [Caulobacteraceae bacterium]|nr:TonB-dependent receptor plug domain-containing protein [Caulobacteraceae bacterium]
MLREKPSPRCERRLRSLLLGAASSALLVVPAAAQEARPGVLGEVVVTARKRQESILNVPVITTAVGAAQLDRLQVTNLRAITSLVPGLLMGEQTATSGIQISLRGVGTTTIDPGVDQSVSLNIDGLQLSQGLALQSGMFDLAQLEVYKGPQSLFYGKSSPGGVISLRTADPTDRFELILRGGYEFEAREQQEDYIISGPVTHDLKVRLAVRHSDSQGYFRNLAVAYPNSGALTPDDDHFNATRRNLMRMTVLWNPADNLEGRLKLNYDRDRIKWANTNELTNCPEGLRELSPGKPYRNPADTCSLDQNAYIVGMDPSAWPGIPFHGVPTLDQAQRYGTLEFNYRPAPHITVTSDTGYYSVRTETLISSTGASYFGTPIASQNDYHRQDLTQELRVNSDYAGPFNFTAGGFYQDG